MPATIQPEQAPAFTSAVTDIPGDVGSDDGVVTSPGDLTIGGNVRRGSTVLAGGNVRIGGTIESATITCAGRLDVPEGRIVGGRISAARALTCRTIGDANGAETEIIVGSDEQALEQIKRRMTDVEEARRKTAAFGQKLAPLLAAQKTLTAAQKEQVSELLYVNGEAEKRTADTIQNLLARLTERESAGIPECTVTDVIQRGVVICFPGLRVQITVALRGPIRLSPAQRGSKTVVLAHDVQSGKSHVIESQPHQHGAALLRAALNALAEQSKR